MAREVVYLSETDLNAHLSEDAVTHRERLLKALNHETPDRVPMDLGSTRVTSIAAAEYEKVKAHFGVDKPTRIIDRIMQTAAVDEEILVALDIDTRGILPGAPDVVRDRDTAAASEGSGSGRVRPL